MKTIDQVDTQVFDKDQKAKFAAECNDKAIADLRKEYVAKLKENRDIMTAARADRDGEDGFSIMDFSKVESMKDMSHSAQVAHFQAEVDRLNIMGAVIDERDFHARLAENLSGMPDRTGDAPAYTPDQVDAIVNQNMAPQTSFSALLERQPEYQAEVLHANPLNRIGKRILMQGVKAGEILAATFKKSAGFEPQIVRSGRIEMADTRPPQLIDFLPRVPAMNGGYAWMQQAALSAENASNRAPSEKAEEASSNEIATTLTEKKVTVEKVVGLLPVTDEQLRHEPSARAFIDMFLPAELRKRVDYQAINGDGSTPNLAGFPGQTGINTHAGVSNDKILDVIVSGVGEIWTDTYKLPNLLVLSFAEYQKILNTKDSQNDYIYGDPNAQTFMTARVWGIPMVLNGAVPANTAYLFDTSDKLFVVDDGIELVYGYNSDDFEKNRQSVRVTMYCNFADVRPTSTCSLTALNNAS